MIKLVKIIGQNNDEFIGRDRNEERLGMYSRNYSRFVDKNGDTIENLRKGDIYQMILEEKISRNNNVYYIVEYAEHIDGLMAQISEIIKKSFQNSNDEEISSAIENLRSLCLDKNY